MNFLDLKYFLTTVAEMNFTKAADKLYITQQSLSGRIAKLENEIGMPLFDRTPPLSLTDAGECLLKYAQSILNQKHEMEQALQDLRDFRSGLLSIAVQTDRGTIILPRLLESFQREYRQVNLSIREGSAEFVTDMLSTGKANLAISFPIQLPDICSIPIFHESFIVVVPNKIFEAFFSSEEQSQMLQAKELPLSVFRNCPFLAYNQATWLKESFETGCKQAGVTPNIVMETSNLFTRSALCLSGLGIMFASSSLFSANTGLIHPSREQLDKVKIFHLSGINCSRDISINYLSTKYQSRAMKEFIRIAKEVFLTDPTF